MPYIKKKDRLKYDNYIKRLVGKLKDAPQKDKDGHMNYIFSRILLQMYDTNYHEFNRMMGLLTCIQAELFRRVIAPYEDGKAKSNGDIL